MKHTILIINVKDAKEILGALWSAHDEGFGFWCSDKIYKKLEKLVDKNDGW